MFKFLKNKKNDINIKTTNLLKKIEYDMKNIDLTLTSIKSTQDKLDSLYNKLPDNSLNVINEQSHSKYIAFSNECINYYRLTQNIGILKKGAVFYHDKEDTIRGSLSNGCLKLCWTPSGDCYSGLCADTVVFHTNFIDSQLFEKC